MTRVAMAVTRWERIIVMGSSSLLASFPDLGDDGNLLEPSLDADLFIEGTDDGVAALLDDVMGEESFFQTRFGYHADFLRSGIRDMLPPGWEDRLVPLADCPGVFCLEPHDLAVAKLRAGRPKDLALLTALVATGRLRPATVRARLDATDMPSAAIVATYRRLEEVTAAASCPPSEWPQRGGGSAGPGNPS